MVVPSVSTATLLAVTLFVDTPFSRLQGVARAKLLGGLILLTIGGVALVLLCWLALRVGRRSLQREDSVLQKNKERSVVDDWATKPLTRPDKSQSDDSLG